LSGWYGKAKFEDLGSSDHPQYPLSVSQPFSFYGSSAQIGQAIGFKLGSDMVMDLGLRWSFAYEDGPYRSFRARVADLSSNFEDCCPSGWSRNSGFDLAFTESANKDQAVRAAVFIGAPVSDLPSYHRDPKSDSNHAVALVLIQPSVAVRYKRIYFAAAFGNNFTFNWGFSCAVGYILF